MKFIINLLLVIGIFFAMYLFGVFFLPSEVDNIASKVGLLDFNHKIREFKTGLDETSTDEDTVFGKALNGINTAKETVDTTLGSTKETIDTIRKTAKDAEQTYETVQSNIETVQDNVESVQKNINQVKSGIDTVNNSINN